MKNCLRLWTQTLRSSLQSFLAIRRRKDNQQLWGCLFLSLLFLPKAAQAQEIQRGSSEPQSVVMQLFVRSDSEVSKQAMHFADQLCRRTRGLELVVHDVLADKNQLQNLWTLARKAGRDKPVVPMFYCCDRFYFGFADAEKSGAAVEQLFTADVYTRSTCPRCADAKVFLKKLALRWPAIRIRIHEITNDSNAARRWQELCQQAGLTAGLPTIYFAGRTLVGFQGEAVTGAQIEQLIQRVAGKKEPAPVKPSAATGDSSYLKRSVKNHSLHLVSFSDATQDSPAPLTEEERSDDVPLPDLLLPEEASGAETGLSDSADPQAPATEYTDAIDLPIFGRLQVSKIGLPLFTLLVGLIDGFNPCAMWILVFLLSVLVNIKDRRKILLIAGTFVVVSGVAYYAFMAAWLNLFMLIGMARPAQIGLGLLALLIGLINVKDFFAFKKGISLSIPESSKPGIYRRVRDIVAAKYLSAAIAGIVVLAVVVNMVELLCTAGLPALYTQILTMQELPPWKNYAYLGLYIGAYMLDDTLLLTAVLITLSHRKLQEREGRWLKLISGLVILVLGMVMIFKPSWLQLGHS